MVRKITTKKTHHCNNLSHGFTGSLYSQLYEFHTCCYWMSTKRLEILGVHDTFLLHYINTTHPCSSFVPYSLRPSKDQQNNSPCTWFLHIYGRKTTQHFEYDACWTRCLNQIYENTNVHLLSVWREFPDRNKGLGFPKNLHWTITIEYKPHFNINKYNLNNIKWYKMWLFVWKTEKKHKMFNNGLRETSFFFFYSFSAHYATLMRFLYWLLLLSPPVCLCREEQTSTV